MCGFKLSLKKVKSEPVYYTCTASSQVVLNFLSSACASRPQAADSMRVWPDVEKSNVQTHLGSQNLQLSVLSCSSGATGRFTAIGNKLADRHRSVRVEDQFLHELYIHLTAIIAFHPSSFSGADTRSQHIVSVTMQVPKLIHL